MEPDLQRLWFKFNMILNGYRAYYSMCNQRLLEPALDPDEKEILDQNLRLYGQYLRRLERMHIDLVSKKRNERPKSLVDHVSYTSPTHSSMEAELDGMVGRLKVEVQAIIGFARLGQGDTFEIHLRHGQQKWRCRGKTQADRTQKWDSTSHLFTCYPDQPLVVKVMEARFLKSKLLSERQFEVAKFFAPQPLLVTMNLNAIGSLKLKMVVAWLPLMTSKTLPTPIEDRHSQMHLGSPAQYHTTGMNTNLLMGASSMSMPAPQTNGVDSKDHLNRSTLTLQSSLVRDSSRAAVSPPRVNLREKKRQSKSIGPNKKEEQQAWRSSTALLDAAYKDLSKSIPAIDDLTAFGAPQHRAMRSECIQSSIPTRPSQPLMGLKASQSLHHLAGDDTQKRQETRPIPAHRSSVYCNTSDLKPNMEQKVSPVNGDVRVEMRGRKSADSEDDSSGVSSLGAAGSVGRRSLHATCERVDSLLQLIERLRTSLAPLRAEEYPEVSAFEAAMLSWEAALKLNRALFVENSRSSQRSQPNRLMKRASLYSVQQPSPPSTLSSEDSNERNGVTGEHIFENDSGIDSLRQPISPYNRQRQFATGNNHLYMNGSLNGRFAHGPTTAMGPAQRRFNKHIQERRRRSLGGWILDDPVECERWLNSLHINADQQRHMGKPTVQVATGHPELDLCLQHHLTGALAELEELAQSRGPLEYRTNELLNRVEQQTLALEEMLRIADALPAWPNVTNLLSDLGADWDQQEVWLATCYAQNASIIVPAERLRLNLHAAAAPIVQKAQYPQLVTRVTDTLMSTLQHSDEQKSQLNQCVSIFEFGALFAGKQFAAYVESIAHEAFITSSLESQQPGAIREIMERLRQVPIVPPMESLRHIGVALQTSESPESATAIERYFRSASNDLQQDLSLSFLHLLENRCPRSRRGACRALCILRSEQALDGLEFLANEDKDKGVREEAQKARDQLQHFFDEYQEITKI